MRYIPEIAVVDGVGIRYLYNLPLAIYANRSPQPAPITEKQLADVKDSLNMLYKFQRVNVRKNNLRNVAAAFLSATTFIQYIYMDGRGQFVTVPRLAVLLCLFRNRRARLDQYGKDFYCVTRRRKAPGLGDFFFM